jgi:hypothetical protein
MSYRSSVNTVGGTQALPDYVYYNADIINNETKDVANGNPVIDPQVRFNEVRDAPLIKDASQYFFSIVRFQMDGSNKDLPLFIPVIQSSTGATNVNLTTYSFALSYKQTWRTNAGDITFTVAPAPRFVEYVPETQNTQIAPVPPSMAAVGARGPFSVIPGTIYQPGDIVWTGINTITGNGIAPFWQVSFPQLTWNGTQVFTAGAWVSYSGQAYYALAPVVGTPPGAVAGQWQLGIPGGAIIPVGTAPYWQSVTDQLGQSLASRYYWVYTYQHWLDLVNQTLVLAWLDTFTDFINAWDVPTYGAFPFASFADFQSYVNVPQFVYNPSTQRFTIYGDSDGYGKRIQTFTPAALAVGALTPPGTRLFLNSNAFGLFSNFPNTYWNETRNAPGLGPFQGDTLLPPRPGNTNFTGYTNEILFPNKFWTNVADYRLPPYSGVAPLGYVPPNGFSATPFQQKPYWLAEQDYPSTDSLWSPIASVVFTSTLLPIRAEATGQPVQLGTSNTGISSASTQSAFQPIITDIALDTSTSGATAYRSFISYAPTAEYRLSDFTSSKQDIRNIDVQVFWKNRLDNNLYPITMFNCSSVSLKLMFKHKDADAGVKG